MIPSPQTHTQTHIIVDMSLWAIQKLCKKPRSQILQLLHSFIPSDFHVVLITMIIVPRQSIQSTETIVEYIFSFQWFLAWVISYSVWPSRILFYNKHTFGICASFSFQNNEIPSLPLAKHLAGQDKHSLGYVQKMTRFSYISNALDIVQQIYSKHLSAIE